MKPAMAALLFLECWSFAAHAQYGTAPNNYYPARYKGSIFTGDVTNSKDDEIALTYTKGKKVETFTGRFEAGCSVPSTQGNKMMPADIPIGTVMTVFFNGNTRKVGDQKVNENIILAIAFDVWQGHKVQEEKKKIYMCTDDIHFQFRAWR